MPEELKNKVEEAEWCELIEYCGDFHPLGRGACGGKKSHSGCHLWTQDINNQYTERFFR